MMRTYKEITMKHLLIIAMMLVGSVFARADIFVGPSAAGSGNCSSFANRCSVANGISAFTSGTANIIRFDNGSYSGGINTFSKSGASTSSHVVLQCDGALSGTVAYAPLAIGKCMFTQAILITGNNVTVQGFDIGNNPNLNVALEPICNSTGSENGQPCPTGGNSVHFIGNYVHQLAANSTNSINIVGCPENGAISASEHGYVFTDQQVIGNIVWKFGGGFPVSGCFNSQGIYPIEPGAIIENNLLVDIPYGALATRRPCNLTIRNNTSISSDNFMVLNNDQASNCPGGVAGNNTINNNAAFNKNYTFWLVGQRASCSSGAPNHINAMKTDGSGVNSSTAYTCDQYSPAVATQAGASFFQTYVAKPTAFAQLDAHLRAGSIGVGTGNASAPAKDIAGTTRAAPHDVGAYKFGGSSSPPSAPTSLTATPH